MSDTAENFSEKDIHVFYDVHLGERRRESVIVRAVEEGCKCPCCDREVECSTGVGPI